MPDSPSPPREVRVGDSVITIESPNAFKVLEASEQIGLISEQVPDLERLYDQARTRAQKRSEQVYTREQILIQFPEAFADFDDDWWAQRGGQVIIPGDSPGDLEIGMSMFLPIYKTARDPVLRLITVLSSPAGELEEAESRGEQALDEYLAGQRRRLMHKGRITDLAVILMRSLQSMREEFDADAEASQALGEIQAFFRGRQARTDTEDTRTQSEPSQELQSSPEPPPAETETEAEAPASAEPATRPASSTSSPAPTDGAPERPSTVAAGASSESSDSPSSASG